MFPLIAGGSTDNAFARALSRAEGSNRGFALFSQPSAEILESASADWTVAGEAFTSPHALVSMLQGDGSAKQMLWEWRPPFLAVESKREDLAVQDRPYITISRISGLFRSELEAMISKATESNSASVKVDSVLSTLGARGIGLSTLLSNGGSQTAGAIGFYATLALSKTLQNSTDPTFILPIDSCDAFLRKLSGNPQQSESNRRADLLLVKISRKRIILSPIEIKCYGLAGESPSRILPGLSDASLADAKNQLLSSMDLLDKLSNKWQEISNGENEADKYLWANGFASLLEAASKIQPLKLEDAGFVRDRLSAVATGEFELATGSGIIAYFSNIPRRSLQADKYYSIEFDKKSRISLLSCQTGYALSNADNEYSKLFTDWQQVVSDATNIQGPTDKPEIDTPVVEPSVTQTAPDTDQKDRDISESTNGSGTCDAGSNNPSKSDRGVIDSSSVDSNKYIGAQEGQAFPQDLNDGVRINVGMLLDTMQESPAWYAPGDTRLNQMNIGIVGDLGTGKTQIIKTLIARIREESRNTQHKATSFLVFDYKNDYQDPDFLEKVDGVVLQPENMPLNIFARSKKSGINNRRRSMEFFDVIQRIYPGVGPVQRQRFAEAAGSAFEECTNRDPVLGEILERYMSLGRPDSVSSILSDFVYGNIFTEDPTEIRSFEDLMSDSVVVVNLHGLGSDQTMKNAIVILFLNLFYDYMKNTTKVSPRPGANIPSVRHIESYLLVDEANNIMKYNFDVLQQLMLESREFGFGVILASQFLSHFSSSKINYAEPLNTWFIHKVPDVTGKQLAQLGLPEADDYTADRIKSLENLCSYYSSYGYRGRFINDNSYYKLYSNLGE
ncbi:ATP-binding protein [Glutamicibacter mishrai]|uniref:ATP-binding protein n=2 Tax=Glutamicibacter mishrai TaxID=1775880 RepID=A0A6H0SKG7_9MICC|nr:ATP-binding protein [Glutamicibacter mishrai]